MSHLLKSRSRNSAFTLVELLIVIAIIGILASLATVGVMKALEKGKMVAARTEISQLEAAIAAAKQNFGGVDNLPSVITLHSRADSLMNDNSQNAIDTKNFLTKAFGKAWIPLPTQTSPTITYSSTPYMYWMGPGYSGTYPVTLTGMEALVFWLGGARDAGGKFQGFSANPTAPWGYTNTKYKLKGPFYEFDAVRIGTNPANSAPTFLNGWNGSYAYFSSTDYKKYFDFNNPAFLNPLKPFVSKYVPPSLLTPPTAYSNSSHIQNGTFTFINNKTFQLVSSGMDQAFGVNFYDSAMVGSSLTPYLQSFSSVYSGPPHQIGEPLPYFAGEGCWWLSFTNPNFKYLEFGYDDLANFSSTQLGKKDE